MRKQGLSLADRIEDEFRFFKTWATSPLKMGAEEKHAASDLLRPSM